MLFSPDGAIFKLVQHFWSIKHKRPLVTLIVRAKKNFVAYFEAEKPKGKRPVGRPPIYGEKVKLLELFDQIELFSKEKCLVYGNIEEVSIAALDLLWKPAGSLIRFVLAVTSRGPIVLMCSDLTQDPIAALELYCIRIRVEIDHPDYIYKIDFCRTISYFTFFLSDRYEFVCRKQPYTHLMYQ